MKEKTKALLKQFGEFCCLFAGLVVVLVVFYWFHNKYLYSRVEQVETNIIQKYGAKLINVSVKKIGADSKRSFSVIKSNDRYVFVENSDKYGELSVPLIKSEYFQKMLVDYLIDVYPFLPGQGLYFSPEVLIEIDKGVITVKKQSRLFLPKLDDIQVQEIAEKAVQNHLYFFEKNCIPAGTFVKAELITGFFTTATEIGQKGNSVPVILKISPPAQLLNNIKTDLKGCFLTAAGRGDSILERVKLQLVSISCISKKSEVVIDQPIKGFIADSDSIVGVRGKIVPLMGSHLVKIAGVKTEDGIKTKDKRQYIEVLPTKNLSALFQNSFCLEIK